MEFCHTLLFLCHLILVPKTAAIRKVTRLKNFTKIGQDKLNKDLAENQAGSEGFFF